MVSPENLTKFHLFHISLLQCSQLINNNVGALKGNHSSLFIFFHLQRGVRTEKNSKHTEHAVESVMPGIR